MRCLSCDTALTPYERSRKTLSGFYLDLCGQCYRSISSEVQCVGNAKLMEACDEEATAFDLALDSRAYTDYTICIDEEDNLDNH